MRAFRRADDLLARHQTQAFRWRALPKPRRAEGAAPGVGVATGKIYWGSLSVLILQRHKLPPAVPINPSDWKD